MSDSLKKAISKGKDLKHADTVDKSAPAIDGERARLWLPPPLASPLPPLLRLRNRKKSKKKKIKSKSFCVAFFLWLTRK